MSTAKSLVSDMLAGLRLDGYNNYDQWHRKMKYLLSENGSIDFITEEIKPLDDRDNADEVWRYSDDLKKAGHLYSDERKRLTLLNSLPDNDDWKQMHFSGMCLFFL